MTRTWIPITTKKSCWHWIDGYQLCSKPATWERVRTPDEVMAKREPQVRCDDHVPAGDIRETEAPSPMEWAR